MGLRQVSSEADTRMTHVHTHLSVVVEHSALRRSYGPDGKCDEEGDDVEVKPA